MPYFFYSNLYLHFLRPCCENIFKIVYIVSEKTVNKSHNLLYCSLLQPAVCLQFPWNRKYFSSAVLRLRGRLFMALWHGFHLFDKESKCDWFLHKGLLLYWLTFLLYLLQSVYRTKYSGKTTNISFLNLLNFLHLFVLKYLRIFLLQCDLISLPF